MHQILVYFSNKIWSPCSIPFSAKEIVQQANFSIPSCYLAPNVFLKDFSR